MKKTIGMLLIAVFANAHSVLATPARNVEIAYDTQKHIIHVSADHPTDKLDKHFIRRVTVEVNGKAGGEWSFARQTSAGHFNADLPFESKGGEHLKIKLYCSQGGTAEEVTILPSIKEEEKT